VTSKPEHFVRIPVFAIAILAALAMSGRALAQPMTRCATCHFANMSSVPAPEHLGEWQRSAHARHQVGCDKCHGGDAWSFVPDEAHRGVLHPTNPASPVHVTNLVTTCGRCHRANAASFNGSLHHSLVTAAERRAPNCTTCHGAMRAEVPSPAALEQRCAECHPAGSPRADYAGLMRAAVESLNALRARVDALDDTVARVTEHARRVELLVALHNARTVIKDAVAKMHSFDVQTLNERLDAARRQIDSLAVASNDSVR
jgi:cytochrome c7-like protein/cytochrome c554/c'-like protein